MKHQMTHICKYIFSFFNRERASSLVRTGNDFDNTTPSGERKQESSSYASRTESFKTQIASVALSALKRDLNRDTKESDKTTQNIHQLTPLQLNAVTSVGSSQSANCTPRKNPPNRLQLAPPPIPKRTFQGRICSDTRLPTSTRNDKVQSKSLSDADNKLDCPNDLCSISFDDIGDSDDLVIFDKKLDPNQSSSDSSRSQTTIDTGYISAFDADRSSVSTTTANQRQFRGRFSSEDTQSSLDSYLSSDLQRADTIDSLHSNFTDSPFVLKKNVNIFNFDSTRLTKKISSSGSIDSDNNNNINNKSSITTPNKSHNVMRRNVTSNRKGIRPPPIPPLRASQLADISE
jgi:hypothetical protein